MSGSQWPQKAKTAAQRANEANRAQQLAVNAKATRPGDGRTDTEGQVSTQGLSDDNRPVGIARKR